jgi:ribonuclease P protein subunit RPR2
MNVKTIARERIEILFREASKAFKEHPERSDRYVEIARKIAMKVNISIPREFKMKFCSKCYSFLKVGVNCRVRNHKGMMIYQCLKCKNFMRKRVKK